MHPRQILDRYAITPKQSLGQNFLYDEGLLARITAAAELSPGDQVLEIGPGLGALTRQLAQAAGRVVAVELDDRLLPILRYELEPFRNVELVHGDILKFDPAAWFDGPFVVVANVPYYITGAILRRLLDERPRPKRLVLTVQREVAERLAAKPPEMSLLAVSVQYYGAVKVVGAVKAGAFWPRPEVDSAIVRIDVDSKKKETTDFTDFTDSASSESVKSVKSVVSSSASEAAFFRVVRAGFSEKRKQLKNNLRHLGLADGVIAAGLEAAGIDGRRRAETLTVEEWGELVEALG
jgi:16S rRNA (adenine1518-N6/adenine1519-N6)-dimethyltransferase